MLSNIAVVMFSLLKGENIQSLLLPHDGRNGPDFINTNADSFLFSYFASALLVKQEAASESDNKRVKVAIVAKSGLLKRPESQTLGVVTGEGASWELGKGNVQL